MVERTPEMSQPAVLLFQRLREQWMKDIIEAFDRFDPYALQGRLVRKTLPSGILRDVGDYDDTATYVPGDVVRGADGRDYRSTQRNTGNDPGPGVPGWEPIEGWNENHTHDGTSGNGIKLDALNTHEDVILGPAVGAIHWTQAAIEALATGATSLDDLVDVEIFDPQPGQVLVYYPDGIWRNVDFDVAGTPEGLTIGGSLLTIDGDILEVEG